MQKMVHYNVIAMS